jgi:hypothetical protein
MSELIFHLTDKTVTDLINLQENQQLNLNPSFQRDSVWKLAHRRRFIETILDGYPVPSIFLYLDDSGTYQVLDGKQRLETIFKFAKIKGVRREELAVKYKLPDEDQERWLDWRALNKAGKATAFRSYRMQVVEVRGELSDIVELFVRINSTGTALTRAEVRHAKFYKKDFMRQAHKLANNYRRYFEEARIVSPAQVIRMKDIELVSELLASLANGGLINKKAAVDRAIAGEGVNGNTLKRIVREFTSTINLVRKIFPNLYATRFHNISEFYSLFMLIFDLQQQNLILGDRKRHEIAQALLHRFSNGVDDVRERQKKLKGAQPDELLYTRYLLSVEQGTDALGQRKVRAEILHGLFAGLFERKDEQRTFSPEQRRMLWNTDDEQYCKNTNCRAKLRWGDFHVDHKRAHSRGGRTSLDNAQLLCPKCNTSKGASSWQRGQNWRRMRKAA